MNPQLWGPDAQPATLPPEVAEAFRIFETFTTLELLDALGPPPDPPKVPAWLTEAAPAPCPWCGA